MTEKTLKRWVVLPAAGILAVWFLVTLVQGKQEPRLKAAWQASVSPGHLSAAHAFLSNNCMACHTANKGVQAASCIACHANDQALLQRQPSAFHASIQSCVECHSEHHGIDHHPIQMSHAALARIVLRTEATSGPDGQARRSQILAWVSKHSGGAGLPPGHPSVSPEETALSCIVCHANQDPHRSFFGADCIQCHTTAVWTIPEYRHPPPTSTSCVQCHQAPPSHYMMHFKMISMKVARQEHANVAQCFLCHQTNSWNDIKGVGWYKHH